MEPLDLYDRDQTGYDENEEYEATHPRPDFPPAVLDTTPAPAPF